MIELSHTIEKNKKISAIALLLSMVLLGVFPIDVLLPSVPSLSSHFNRSPADIALSISLFAVGISISQLFIGPLSDKIGRKNLLLTGMAISMLGALGCALVNEYSLFLLFRLIQALGCGCFVLSQALVQDLFEGKERDRLRILIVTASGIFISLSPLAGASLQNRLDWPGSFYIFTIVAAVVFIKAYLLLENPIPIVERAPHRSIFQSYRHICTDIKFLGYWLIAALVFTCHFSFIVASPLIFMEHLQLSEYEFSLTLLFYGAAYVIGGAVAGLLSTKITANTQITVGLCFIFCAGMMLFYLSHHFGLSTITMLIPMIICTAGTTITRPAATSKAMECFPDQAGASASAGNTLIFVCGGLISALVNLSPVALEATLALSFLLLSTTGLGLNTLIQRRNQRPVFE
ncbi:MULTISPECIES: multidrug effflux MFS transporter [Pseudomonas]|uniref:Multidrug effflux MFS transporter n=1 Tax=Pseudomonas gingeri TaxID=117681 RepID=A0A7Y7WR78_9PSED|nr:MULTISPECIES: multidrug effflux MFS transporter [Pseudomonas]MPQ65532.1 MFS transporter [Pseudomonas sp. MWU12-2323]NWB86186.1 multidrug effflux MFS transporter [Pseudomonas gingeri]